MNFNILGRGGLAREVAGILYDNFGLSYYDGDDRINFFEDGEFSAVQQLLFRNAFARVFVGVGSPQLKKKFADQLKQTNLKTPILKARTFVERDYNNSNKIGAGSVFCDGVVITNNIIIGQFVTINLNCTIGHDTQIGDYSTLAPGCNISGNVKIGKLCDLGSNVTIIPGVELPDGGIIGAGTVLTKSPEKLYVFDTYDKNFWDDKKGKTIRSWDDVDSYLICGNPGRIIKLNGVRVDV